MCTAANPESATQAIPLDFKRSKILPISCKKEGVPDAHVCCTKTSWLTLSRILPQIDPQISPYPCLGAPAASLSDSHDGEQQMPARLVGAKHG